MDYRIRELKPEDNRRIEYIIRTCLVEFGADHAAPLGLTRIWAVFRRFIMKKEASIGWLRMSGAK